MLHLQLTHPLNGARESYCVLPAQVECVLQAHTPAQVLPQLHALQKWQAQGYFAAGFLSYEAAAGLRSDLAQALQAPTGRAADTQTPTEPLLYFVVFRTYSSEAPPPSPALAPAPTPSFQLDAWQAELSPATYAQRIAEIQQAIAQGQSYQVNYTLPFTSTFRGDAYALYRAMRVAQRAPYAAYIDCGAHTLISASPELFFHWEGPTHGGRDGRCGQLITQPMKGTRPRGLWSAQDEQLAAALAESAKDRAENVMIVDLLRNDMGRIAETGSVAVENLFAVAPYPSVWQMTSRIRARTRPEVDLAQVFQALFPCGSITGAPKLQTMRLIAALEHGARGAYCGSIGILRPDGSATFSVAIRTLSLGAENEGQRSARYHAGAGITWSSEAGSEWQETLAKTRVVHADFLQQQAAPFALIETLLWTGHKFAWLARHQERLTQSAQYYGYAFDAQAWLPALEAAVSAAPADPADHTHSTQPQRVRALLHADGRIEVSSTPLPLHTLPTWSKPTHDTPAQLFSLATHPTAKNTPWLYHKTTQRSVYEAVKQGAPAHVFDVLLHNEEGQLCEFTIGNLLLQLGGVVYTPPIACGLLPGVLRAELLAQGAVQERVLHADDLARAEGIWLINSVRGWLPMRLFQP